MKHVAAAGFLTMALCVLPVPAQAQGQAAFTAKTVNLRAGPAREYPVVAVLSPGVQILVQGCLDDFSWCDVATGPYRGWAYGGNINYFYQNAYVPLMTWGPVIGIGILGFALDDYWGRHYRNRPFYRERHRWEGRFAPPPRHIRPQPDHRRPFPGAGPVAPGPRPQEAVPLQTRPRGGVRPAPQGAPLPGVVPAPGTGTQRQAPPGAVPPGAAQPRPVAPRAHDGPRPRQHEGQAQRPREGAAQRREGQAQRQHDGQQQRSQGQPRP